MAKACGKTMAAVFASREEGNDEEDHKEGHEGPDGFSGLPRPPR